MEMQFVDIPEFEGLYQASRCGNIKSVARLRKYRNTTRKIPEKLLSKRVAKHGYEMVTLRKNQKHLTKYVHRLVIQAFCGKSNLDVNHINGDKSDNRIENLEYCTRSKNCLHYHRVTKRGMKPQSANRLD